MTTSTDNITCTPARIDPTNETAVPTRLWTIDDVAHMLRRCENTTRAYLTAWDDTPAPLFSDRRGQVWDPRDWWAWAANRSAATTASTHAKRTKSHPATGTPKGRKTRV